MNDVKRVLIIGHKKSVSDAVDVAKDFADRTKYYISFRFDSRYYDTDDPALMTEHLNSVAKTDILYIVNSDNLITPPMQAAINLAKNLGIEIQYLNQVFSEEEKATFSKLWENMLEEMRKLTYDFKPLSEYPIDNYVSQHIDALNERLVDSIEDTFKANIIINHKRREIIILDDEAVDINMFGAIPMVFPSIPEKSEIKWKIISEKGEDIGTIQFLGRPDKPYDPDTNTVHYGVLAEFTSSKPVQMVSIDIEVNPNE